ncbi:MAG: HAD-IA family hydrolase [Clostridiales bacterium]
MKLLEIDLILFDLDGVLIDSSEDITNSVNLTLKEFGFTGLPKEEIVSFLGHGPKDLIDKAFGNQSNMLKVNALKFYKNNYYNNCTNKTRLYDDVEIFLKKFKNKKMAVVTNKLENPSKRILNFLDVVNYFNLIVGPDSIAKLKPDSEGILKVLNELSVDPKKTIMIGDSNVDIIAGKSAGVHTCGIKNRFGNQEDLLSENPDYLIDSLEDLVKKIK